MLLSCGVMRRNDLVRGPKGCLWKIHDWRGDEAIGSCRVTELSVDIIAPAAYCLGVQSHTCVTAAGHDLNGVFEANDGDRVKPRVRGAVSQSSKEVIAQQNTSLLSRRAHE